jgi:purine-binding chemotaxis protein CheW
MTDDAFIPWDADEKLEVLAFELGDETFALEAGMVQEILDLMPETVVPGAPRLFPQVINFRGKVIPLADLRVAFGMGAPSSTIDNRIIVITFDFEGTHTLVGLKADKVHEVTTLTRATSEAAPRIGMRWRQDFVRSLVRRGEDVLLLPNLDRIFSSFDEAQAPAATSAPIHH